MSLEPAPPDAVPRAHLAIIESALARYGLAMLAPPEPVVESVLSDNYRVMAADGPRFLRIHKATRTIERIEGEYSLLSWAGDRGVPVVRPLADSEGRTIHRLGGRFVSLFPWLDARMIDAANATPSDAARLGAIHGRVTSVLRDFDDPWLREHRRYPRWDTAASIAALSRVDDLIRYYPAPGERLLAIQERIRFQLALLESERRPVSEFDGLGRQACFGDFHNRQVLFGPDGGVAAVVDWEGLLFGPPAWELTRALTLSFMLEPSLLEPYLRAYAEHAVLAGGECGPAVEAWWQFLIHDTWSLTTRFIQGDRRPDRFFEAEASYLRQFADPAYRAWLATELERFAR